MVLLGGFGFLNPNKRIDDPLKGSTLGYWEKEYGMKNLSPSSG